MLALLTPDISVEGKWFPGRFARAHVDNAHEKRRGKVPIMIAAVFQHMVRLRLDAGSIRTGLVRRDLAQDRSPEQCGGDSDAHGRNSSPQLVLSVLDHTPIL